MRAAFVAAFVGGFVLRLTPSAFQIGGAQKLLRRRVAAPPRRGRLSCKLQEADLGTAGTSEVELSSLSTSDVFCNRELNLRQIDAVGFDMDFTLAQYETAFDLLAFDGAKEKLVEMGYPEEVLSFPYDPTEFTRGLIIDKAAGNFLKIDRHKYVRVASHGSRVLSSAERKRIYRPSFEGSLEFKGSNFVKMDTLFHVVDANLFAQLVDLKDRDPTAIEKPYEQIYKDVRACVDLCHRDGTIKAEVGRNPFPYIKRDEKLIGMLKAFRKAGKKVFLLTNSFWEYTDVVMNHLWGNEPDSQDLEWTSLFDVIISGASKPHFLTDPHLSLFRVNPKDGTLENTDGVGDDPQAFLAQGKIFQGGNYQDLHKMLEISTGEGLLYVGDHMFSDVLRTKRSLGWRTCLIIPELDDEIAGINEMRGLADDIRDLRHEQYAADLRVDKIVTDMGLDAEHLDEALLQIDQDQAEIKEKLKEATDAYHARFHPRWGQLFKAGYQDSQFAKQVAGYACLYTSKASNLGSVSPLRHFRPATDIVPHEVDA